MHRTHLEENSEHMIFEIQRECDSGPGLVKQKSVRRRVTLTGVDQPEKEGRGTYRARKSGVQTAQLPQKEFGMQERKPGNQPAAASANPHNGLILQSFFLRVQSITIQVRHTPQCHFGLGGTSGPPVGGAQQIENGRFVWIQVRRLP